MPAKEKSKTGIKSVHKYHKNYYIIIFLFYRGKHAHVYAHTRV